MSMFTATTQPCPNCGNEATFDAFGSVNADRRADLRAEILTEVFMRVTCAACQSLFRLEPDLNYLDMGRGQWILAKPIFKLPTWDEEEATGDAQFQEAFGSRAPASARAIGDDLSPRLTFGWPALREKILANSYGLNDADLESVKLFILKERAENPLAPGVELRLVDVGADVLNFAWLEGAGGKVIEMFEAQRALYDAVAADPAWSALKGKLADGLFVDAQRLFIETATSEQAQAV